MALGTSSHEPNPQMPAPGTPGAAPHSTDPRDPSKPWLDQDDDKVDWVILLRCYPHATSKAELRAAAMKAGAEVEKAAEAAKASKDVPMAEQKSREDWEPPAPARQPAAQPAPQPHH